MIKKLISTFILTVMVFNISLPCFANDKDKKNTKSSSTSRTALTVTASTSVAGATLVAYLSGKTASDLVKGPHYPSADDIRQQNFKK